MSDYQSDRFTMFLVEDNNYIRQTVDDLLRTSRIARIVTAVNVEDAIGYLKDIYRAHIDSMRAVTREKVSGDGGQIGKELLAGLKAAVQRYKVVE